MSQLYSHPAFWGFLAAVVYAGMVLSKGLWLDEPPPDARRRKYLIAGFVLALVFGRLAAEVGTADAVIRRVRAPWRWASACSPGRSGPSLCG